MAMASYRALLFLLAGSGIQLSTWLSCSIYCSLSSGHCGALHLIGSRRAQKSMSIYPWAALPCAMVLAGVFAGHWLGNKKMPILEWFAVFLVACIVLYVLYLVWLVLK